VIDADIINRNSNSGGSNVRAKQPAYRRRTSPLAASLRRAQGFEETSVSLSVVNVRDQSKRFPKVLPQVRRQLGRRRRRSGETAASLEQVVVIIRIATSDEVIVLAYLDAYKDGRRTRRPS
jgi:hypothetical protein